METQTVIKTVTIQQVRVHETKSGTKKSGDKWEAKSVGIKVNDQWHNAFLFKNNWDFIDELKENEGGEMTLAFYEEEYNGEMQPKFKKVSNADITNAKLDGYGHRIGRLEEKVFGEASEAPVEESAAAITTKPKAMTETQKTKLETMAKNAENLNDTIAIKKFLEEDHTYDEAEAEIKRVEAITKPDDDLPF